VTTLRQVTSEQDIQITASLAHAIWNQHFPPIIGQSQVDYMVEKFQSLSAITQQINQGYAYYLIEHQDCDVGYLALVPDPERQQVQLSKFYITDTMRGQGIGKAALHRIIQITREQGYTMLWLTVNKYNASTIAAYESMGFVTTDSLEMDIGNGFIMDDYRMEIDIPQ
jgi:GNAT superfamily N-acetyltransferase